MTYRAGVLDGGHGPNWHTATILGNKVRALSSTYITTAASTAWPANNDAYLIPFLVSAPTTIVRMFWTSGTLPGTTNYDLGIYNDAFALVRSVGATAAVNTTTIQQPAGGAVFTGGQVTLVRGRYFMAMSSAATTLTVVAGAGLNGTQRMLGMLKMASAHPLPSTFVPVSMGATTLVPSIGMMTVSGSIL